MSPISKHFRKYAGGVSLGDAAGIVALDLQQYLVIRSLVDDTLPE